MRRGAASNTASATQQQCDSRPESSELCGQWVVGDSAVREGGVMATEYLRRCVELAAQALDAGDHPFGSVLVGPPDVVLAEERNREVTDADPTAHPELALARWA